jgi:hypothetical protein
MPGPRKDSLLPSNATSLVDPTGKKINIDKMAREKLGPPPEKVPVNGYQLRTVTLIPWRDIEGYEAYPHVIDMWYRITENKKTEEIEWTFVQTMTRAMRLDEQPPKKKQPPKKNQGTKKPPTSNTDEGGLADDLE